MTTLQHETIPPELFDLWIPDHTQLPETDGSFVKNFQEHPQSILLTEAIEPVLQQRHPDGDYAIGQDCGIYWNIEQVQNDHPERAAVAPDWFYVPGVAPLLDGQFRRSYVLWKELVPPFLIIEFASGDGAEERDPTPRVGKFWIYENFLRPAFYVIFVFRTATLEVYHFVERQFERMAANAHGHFALPRLGVALGLWQGRYHQAEATWLRWWDLQGNLLLTGSERAAQERAAKEQERAAKEQERAAKEQERAAKEQALTQLQQERERAERMAARLRELGIELEE